MISLVDWFCPSPRMIRPVASIGAVSTSMLQSDRQHDWDYWQYESLPQWVSSHREGKLIPATLLTHHIFHPTGSSGYFKSPFASTPHPHQGLHSSPGQPGPTAEPVMRLISNPSLKGLVQGIIRDIISSMTFVEWLAT